MGGGGSSYGGTSSSSAQQVGKIFDKATQDVERQVKQRGEEHRVRNVFISFHSDDERKVDLLRSQARREEYDLEFRDHSIKAPTPKWKREVDKKIDGTSATIVMIGPHTADRPNVEYEIGKSYEKNKKVIGVMIRSDKDYKIPKSMRDNKAPIVPWKLATIQKELDKSK